MSKYRGDPLGDRSNNDTHDPIGDDADNDMRDPIGDHADKDARDPIGDVADKDMRDPLADESVSYRKPPSKYTWKPGQSGNPRGRRREADEDRNLYDVINEFLDDPVSVKNGGTLSGEDVIAEQIMTEAGNGDPRAFREFIRLCRRAKFFERLALGPRLPEGVRPADFLKGQIAELRRKLEKFDRRPAKT